MSLDSKVNIDQNDRYVNKMSELILLYSTILNSRKYSWSAWHAQVLAQMNYLSDLW